MKLFEVNKLSATGRMLALPVSFGCINACATILFYYPERSDMLGVGLVIGIATLLAGLTGKAIWFRIDRAADSGGAKFRATLRWERRVWWR